MRIRLLDEGPLGVTVGTDNKGGSNNFPGESIPLKTARTLT